MGLFDGLPVPQDKAYLREDLENVDESWTVARFDSLPHVVHILTSKDRDAEIQTLKDQSDIVEEVVDEVVQTYHGGFNRAIQNYSQILRLFSESTQSIGKLKVDLGNAKKVISARNKQLHQLWYRSMTLRHIISLLDQIENIAQVPARINKLIDDNQLYAAVQVHVQSARMLEREGLQTVGALQDVRSELSKLRGVLFYKVLEALHAHLYNTGEYSSATPSMNEKDDAIPTTTVAAFSMNNSHSRSRRTRLLKNDSHVGGSGFASSVDGGSSYDGHDDDDTNDGTDNNGKDMKNVPRLPTWLLESTPDEFVETMRKSESPLHVKYLQTMVECLCMLGKVAAAGAMICQRLRPTIHEIITSKIKAQAEYINSSRPGVGHSRTGTTGLQYVKGQLQSYQLSKEKHKNGTSLAGTLLAVSPVSPVMAPMGAAQSAAKELLDSILDAMVRIFDNHVVVGELLESKSSQQANMNTPKSMVGEISGNPDSEASHATGGYTIGFSMTVLQSECQQLICEILRATPEAASADAAVQTARLASKTPSKDKRMFYFFFESRGRKTDPVVIWLTGGPGCSSELALFYENGPFKIEKNSSLSWNEYGWDQASNLLFVDQPTGTGFSYTSDKRDIRHDEQGVSDDLYDFLQAFFKEHPEYAKNDFFITGESYAGHYIPAFAARVHQGNKAKEGIHINLKGFAIGNGLTDPLVQYKAYTDYALDMGIITESDHKNINKRVPVCETAIKLCGTDGTTACMAAYLACNTIFSSIKSIAGNINHYDIRKQCEGSLCYDFSNMEDLLSKQSVKEALGVGDIDFVSCSPVVYQAMIMDWMRNLEAGIPHLLEDGIKLLVYAGEYDLICNWLGNSRWVHAMEWSGQKAFGATADVPFKVDGSEAGLFKTHGPLSFLKVHDAGHMVPMDQPKAALSMLKRWMKGSLSESTAEPESIASSM